MKMKLCQLSTLWSKAWNIALFFCGTWPTVNVNLWGGVASASRHQWTSPQPCNHPWKKPPSETLCLPWSLLITALSFVYLCLLNYFSPWFDSVLWILSGQTHYHEQILELFLCPLALRKSPCVLIWSYLTFGLVNHTISPCISAAMICHAMEYQ